jgi:hypothetical protein
MMMIVIAAAAADDDDCHMAHTFPVLVGIYALLF